MKNFVALARVSSREQEREGFSLAVQEDALKRYAQQAGGVIVTPFLRRGDGLEEGRTQNLPRMLVYAKRTPRNSMAFCSTK